MRVVLLIISLLVSVSQLAAQEYGVTDAMNRKSLIAYPGRGWTIVYKDGSTAWGNKVQETLLKRGFTQKQAIAYGVLSHTFDRGKTGRYEYSSFNMPLQVNTETGKFLSLDPVKYANGLPDCYAIDESACKLIYAAHPSYMARIKGGQFYLDKRTAGACKLTQKQRSECRQWEFKLSYLGAPISCYQDALSFFRGCAGLPTFEPVGQKVSSKIAFEPESKKSPAKKAKSSKPKKVSSKKKSGKIPYGSGYCPPWKLAESCTSYGVPEKNNVYGPFPAKDYADW